MKTFALFCLAGLVAGHANGAEETDPAAPRDAPAASRTVDEEKPTKDKARLPYRRMDRKVAELIHICRRLEVEARNNELPAGFLVRLIWKESRFDTHAISPKGARGIAQFMPGTAKARGLDDPFDARSAIAASALYLSELRTMFGNVGLAAAAYNSGENRVTRWRAGKTGLPNETEDYVFSITGFTTDTWALDKPPDADFTLDEEQTVQQACRALPIRRAPPQPRYAYAHNNQGVKYLRSGDYERAIAHFDRAVQIRPRFPKAFYNRALAHRSLGTYDQAISDYTTAIRHKANYPEAYNNRGIAHFRNSDLDAAIADYSKAIKFNPKYVSAFNNRAVAWRAKGDLVKALSDLTVAIRLQPAYASAYANRGLVYLKLGQRKNALADLQQAIRIDPKHRLARAGLARLGTSP